MTQDKKYGDYRVVEEEKAECYICNTKFMNPNTFVNSKGDIWVNTPDEILCENTICMNVSENIKEIRKLRSEINNLKIYTEIKLDGISFALKWYKRIVIASPFIFALIHMIIRFIFN